MFGPGPDALLSAIGAVRSEFGSLALSLVSVTLNVDRHHALIERQEVRQEWLPLRSLGGVSSPQTSLPLLAGAELGPPAPGPSGVDIEQASFFGRVPRSRCQIQTHETRSASAASGVVSEDTLEGRSFMRESRFRDFPNANRGALGRSAQDTAHNASSEGEEK